ncbi:MAG: DNA topoisomerase IV subunit B [Neisseriaceae bacterium]
MNRHNQVKGSAYNESSITILRGLDPIKQRPGMYTRTEDPTHIAEEVIDNAVDEALAGFASIIKVTVFPDLSLQVEDNGRGIPVGIHPEEQLSVVELVFTRLHAGGKFSKKEGAAYTFSGGLHGVGVSVTNALSSRMEVTIKRDGGVWRIVFEAGNVVEGLKNIDSCQLQDTGTIIRLWPDPQYFESPHYALAKLRNALKAKAVLLSGLQISLIIHTDKGKVENDHWCYSNGVKGYLEGLLARIALLHPVSFFERYLTESTEDFLEGEGAAVALAWSEEGEIIRESYVNLIATPSAGTHEIGLKQVVFNAVDKFIQLHHLLPRGVKLQSEDVFSRLSYVLSVRMLEPQFQGQTKEKLSSRHATRLVVLVLQDTLDLWLNQNIELGKKIADLSIRQARKRMLSSKKIERKKGSGLAVLPGKLTECESEDIRENELFLVEGESAGGSAKLARNKYNQALLPLRGKVLNSFEVSKDKLLGNSEIHDIAVAIGVEPHTATEEVNLNTLRYGKIAILSDADVDGAHIQVLLLTLFYRHFPKLIESGHIFVAQPPLFRIDVSARGKRPSRKYYALDEEELHSVISHLKKEGVGEGAYSVSRFKGLGEMQPQQLRDTTMDPDSRRLLQVKLQGDAQTTQEKLLLLMGKGEAASRREWIESNGNKVEVDI